MEEIIKRTEPQYIIIRRKDDIKEYFCGADLYGTDNDGVLRVSKTKWSKTFTPISATYRRHRMRDILNGMQKYGEIEDGYSYAIAEVQTTTVIVNYTK